MTSLDQMQRDLDALGRQGRRRTLRPIAGVDFSSNDYLGLARASVLRDAASDALARGVALGSGGSRLLRGNDGEHIALEAEAAAHFGSQAALFVGSGYAANTLLLATLPQRGDLVLYDALIHASTHEGMRLGRAEFRAFAHNDPAAAQDAIGAWRKQGGTGHVWIAVESLYSMDGDRAPLAAFDALAQREGAMLLIDEAHATGIYGAQGRGLADGMDRQAHVIVIRTCGKALGCEGALILCAAPVREFLINRARGFIFSTAPSPLIAAVVRASLTLLSGGKARQDRLHRLIDHAGRAWSAIGIDPSGSAIQPVVLGDAGRAMDMAHALQQRGYDIRGIRPPSVPEGGARLRITLTLNVTEQQVTDLAACLKDLL